MDSNRVALLNALLPVAWLIVYAEDEQCMQLFQKNDVVTHHTPSSFGPITVQELETYCYAFDFHQDARQGYRILIRRTLTENEKQQCIHRIKKVYL